MKDKVRYTMRINAELWAKFSKIAERNHRSVNMELQALIERYVESLEK